MVHRPPRLPPPPPGPHAPRRPVPHRVPARVLPLPVLPGGRGGAPRPRGGHRPHPRVHRPVRGPVRVLLQALVPFPGHVRRVARLPYRLHARAVDEPPLQLEPRGRPRPRRPVLGRPRGCDRGPRNPRGLGPPLAIHGLRGLRDRLVDQEHPPSELDPPGPRVRDRVPPTRVLPTEHPAPVRAAPRPALPVDPRGPAREALLRPPPVAAHGRGDPLRVGVPRRVHGRDGPPRRPEGPLGRPVNVTRTASGAGARTSRGSGTCLRRPASPRESRACGGRAWPRGCPRGSPRRSPRSRSPERSGPCT